MKLNVQNIGRVNVADIDLRGITVVAGENASGKSTVSKSLFSILEIFFDLPQSAENQRRRSEIALVRKWFTQGYLPIRFSVKDVRELYYLANGDEERFVDSVFDTAQKSGLGKILHGSEYYERIRTNISEFFVAYQEICEKSIEYYGRYASQVMLDSIFKEQINCLKGDTIGRILYQNEQDFNEIVVYKNRLEDIASTFFKSENIKPIYITTSDLMSTVGGYRKLYSAEKNDMISYANIQLTQLLMDEISTKELIAEEYQRLEEQKQQFEELFKQVLEGEIYLDNNQLTYHDNWCDENVELQNVASGMKIFLVLKRLIHNGVFLKRVCLIMDEPETNLHPEWQLILAHLLVVLNLRMQVKIYVNSHSPYFVRAMEYYANEYQVLDRCNFYMMEKGMELGLFQSVEVTQKLGEIYDKLAEPFNKIM